MNHLIIRLLLVYQIGKEEESNQSKHQRFSRSNQEALERKNRHQHYVKEVSKRKNQL